MKFSIRDLFLVTMIVALAVGLGIEQWRVRVLQSELEEMKQRDKGWRESVHDLIVAEKEGTIREGRVPSSSAPAPNPPKR